MKLTAVTVALVAALGLSACDQITAGEDFGPPPGPPAPPSPDLPMTAAKARLIMGAHSNTCRELATLKYDMHACELKQGHPASEEALRTDLRDLRWNLDKLTPDEVAARCAAVTNELRKTPKPRACW
jgi:hypothetical protein